MKLSNTLIMNETVLPSNRQAFTLAEVLITLSILGIVAALTIPSLINRQSDSAAIVKLKKAISTYEQMAGVYMVENEATSLNGVITTCDTAQQYFKATNCNTTDNGVALTTGDGALWVFPTSGNPVVLDSARRPRFGVYMWAEGGEVNYNNTNTIDGIDYRPLASTVPSASVYPSSSADTTAQMPIHGFFNANTFIDEGTNTLIGVTGNNRDTSPSAAMDGMTRSE